jgi:DUF4097 and DUF4098 domain-containing protein YvlB
MSTAQIYNLSGDQGSTFIFGCQWLQNDTEMDLTNWSGKMQLRQGYNCTGVEAEASTENSLIALSSSGTITINLLPTQTSGLNLRNYVYDIDLSSGNFTRTLLKGNFIVFPEVTR